MNSRVVFPPVAFATLLFVAFLPRPATAQMSATNLQRIEELSRQLAETQAELQELRQRELDRQPWEISLDQPALPPDDTTATHFGELGARFCARLMSSRDEGSCPLTSLAFVVLVVPAWRRRFSPSSSCLLPSI